MSYESSVAAASDSEHVRGAVPSNGNDTLVGRLAEFFPLASPVRLAVCVTAADGRDEKVLLEYATGKEVFFASALPWEFGERLRLSNADGSLDVEVVIVAVQFQAGRTAVAARFLHPVVNWIVKP